MDVYLKQLEQNFDNGHEFILLTEQEENIGLPPSKSEMKIIYKAP